MEEGSRPPKVPRIDSKHPVKDDNLKRIGPYILGQRLGTCPVKSIVQCLGREPRNDSFYTLRILTLPEDPSKETKDDIQGKMLIHTEYSLLSLLSDVEGVIKCHGLLKDVAIGLSIGGGCDPPLDSSSMSSCVTRSQKKRVTLILDCLFPHEFSPSSKHFVNLQNFIVQEKRLSEKTALRIFYQIVSIVAEIHDRNIVHRDLKLGNIVLNRRNKKVTIINFCLGKQLLREDEQLTDQRGSPAYISPDILTGKPYLGKPADVWALGVILYIMIYGQFPFFDPDPKILLSKIKAGELILPSEIKVTIDTQTLIQKMLHQNAKQRLTASQVRDCVTSIMVSWIKPKSSLQVVPELEHRIEIPLRKRPTFHVCARLHHFHRNQSVFDSVPEAQPSVQVIFPQTLVRSATIPSTSCQRSVVLPRAPFGRVVAVRTRLDPSASGSRARERISVVRLDTEARLMDVEEANALKRRLSEQQAQPQQHMHLTTQAHLNTVSDGHNVAPSTSESSEPPAAINSSNTN